jgi:uncharacterized protein YjbI with pentapeptide repeats
LEPKKPALKSKSESEKVSGPWRPTKRQVLWIIGMVVALLTTALLIVNLRPEIWKGLLEERTLTLIAIGVSLTAIVVLLAIGGAASRWTGFRGKTVWDVLQLLIVPLALAVVGFLFTMQQDIRQQDIEDERARQARNIEDQRAAAERELAKQRAQDEMLRAYLDQMSHLLLAKNLRGSEEDSVVRTLARAQTATVIQSLDGSRNQNVIRFLDEAHLIGKDQPSIHLLAKSNLQDAGLFYADLFKADLREANLTGANLEGADLSGANLHWATLREADLQEASLGNVNLSGAFLDKADLHDAWLNRADLSDASLKEVNLQNAYPQDVDLRRADVRRSDLRKAYLFKADLSKADLSKVNLSKANLSKVNLRGAKGVTNEQLRAATSLEGASMPDGQTLRGDKMPNGPTLEEWIKDREKRQQDE